MADYHETPLQRMSDGPPPILIDRVFGIWNHQGERITKHCYSFVEGHAMLPEALCGLVWVPLKLIQSRYRRRR